MNKPAFKRKEIFIDKQFQAQFILKFCTLVAIGGLLTIAILYFWAGKSTTVSVVHSRVAVRTTADFLLPILIQTVIIVMVIVGLATILVTLFVSHKIAGPLYRLKKAMENLEAGNLVEDFRIRRNDQLQNIAETYNSMIKKIREVIKNLKTNIPNIKEKLDSIQEHELSEQKRSILSELKKVSEDLNKLVNYFKT